MLFDTQLACCEPACRRRFWFWDSIVLMQTFALASAQVFALALSAYFQLTIMLMILVVGFAILAFFQPFEAPLSQTTQVCFCLCYMFKCSNVFYAMLWPVLHVQSTPRMFAS